MIYLFNATNGDTWIDWPDMDQTYFDAKHRVLLQSRVANLLSSLKQPHLLPIPNAYPYQVDAGPTPIEVLLVIDDQVEVEAIKLALKLRGISNPVHVATNRVEAFAKLKGESRQTQIPRPNVIIVDLPISTRNDFLERLRDDEELNGSTVFLLSTSDSDADKLEAYQWNIAGYLFRTHGETEFANLVNMIDFYQRHVMLQPPKPKVRTTLEPRPKFLDSGSTRSLAGTRNQ